MYTKSWILIAGLAISLAVLACSKPEPAPVEEAAPSQVEIEKERETARRLEATTALESRLSSASGMIAQLGDATGAGQLPTDLATSIGRLRAEIDQQQSLLAELKSGDGDTWEAARERLEKALADLESGSNAAKKSLVDWQKREQDAMAARANGEAVIDPATGLIQGLDGGDYEPYLVSVVQSVQQRLRRLGFYAGPADGVFDSPLRAAVGSFQEHEELSVSGVPSPMTRSRLFSE